MAHKDLVPKTFMRVFQKVLYTFAAMKKAFKDKDLQYLLGNLLRVGVIVSMTIVALGLLFFLIQHGRSAIHLNHFDARNLFSFSDFIARLKSGHSAAVIELGVLCLIATPVFRVIFAIIGFGKEKDGMYVLISSIVLAIIIMSIFLGALF